LAKNPNLKRAHATSEFDGEKILELKKCRADPIYFMEKYVKVQHPVQGPVPFVLYPYQREMVLAIHENKDTILLCSRQMGKTTVAAMYLLWFATFFRAKRCVIASYEELPEWLKAGCTFYNRTSIEFDNKSVIISEATSEKTGRGSSPSIIFLDEIAFISRRIQDEMWGSLTPALSTGGKFVITSTPNGDSDLFATLWRGANSGQNSFKPLQFLWWQHPDRDKKYYDEMAGKLGPIRARQELDCLGCMTPLNTSIGTVTVEDLYAHLEQAQPKSEIRIEPD
jgi:hypothetical protein